MDWIDAFVQAQFFNYIYQSYSVAHWQSVCFSSRRSLVRIPRLEGLWEEEESFIEYVL